MMNVLVIDKNNIQENHKPYQCDLEMGRVGVKNMVNTRTILDAYIKKLKRLKELKEEELNNIYHDWDKEIADTEHNIAECIVELN